MRQVTVIVLVSGLRDVIIEREKCDKTKIKTSFVLTGVKQRQGTKHSSYYCYNVLFLIIVCQFIMQI